MQQSPNNLIWIDLEMTGLDPMQDHIIEIATIVTSNELEIIEEGPAVAINVEASILATMDEWNTRQHSKSGLVERISKSPYSTGDAEQMTLNFIRKHVPENASPMCGNSICQDRRFMARLMPELERYFHYRNLDVSSFKILVNRWAPDRAQYIKEPQHQAMNDVRDSIEELRFYRQRYFHL
jgi:oligoribonuclease